MIIVIISIALVGGGVYHGAYNYGGAHKKAHRRGLIAVAIYIAVVVAIYFLIEARPIHVTR